MVDPGTDTATDTGTSSGSDSPSGEGPGRPLCARELLGMAGHLSSRLLRQQDAVTLPSGRTLAVGQRVRVRTSDARVRGLESKGG